MHPDPLSLNSLAPPIQTFEDFDSDAWVDAARRCLKIEHPVADKGFSASKRGRRVRKTMHEKEKEGGEDKREIKKLRRENRELKEKVKELKELIAHLQERLDALEDSNDGTLLVRSRGFPSQEEGSELSDSEDSYGSSMQGRRSRLKRKSVEEGRPISTVRQRRRGSPSPSGEGKKIINNYKFYFGS